MAEELHVSGDDLAVAAAKEKLAALADRRGYREAMRPRPTGSRRAMSILGFAGLVFVAFAYGACTYVSASWLRLPMSGVFVVLAVLAWFLAIGASPDPPAEAWPVVVLGKVPDADPASPSRQLSLLRDNGASATLTAGEALFGVVRAGDVGVAHVRSGMMIAFHRL